MKTSYKDVMLILGVVYINEKKNIKFILNEIEVALNEINSKYPH